VETEKDFRKAIERERRLAQQKPVLWYSMERVEYAAQLRRYHEAFSREQVLVLIYDDFRADNAGTVRRVLRFIGVDEDAPIATSEANKTVLVRSPRAYDMVRSLYLGRGRAAIAAKAAVKAVVPRALRRQGLRRLRDTVLYASPPPPDEELMLELRRRFKGEVEALSDYLERDLLSTWGYDRIE
ncbi:MAG: hypothetical protein QOF54_1895, partial [Solirubrobacteraceae bacterium]|nr:hypothetical protein [Solirubrobacteraceae bacterium]